MNFGSRRVAGSEPRADCLPCVLVTCFEIPSAQRNMLGLMSSDRIEVAVKRDNARTFFRHIEDKIKWQERLKAKAQKA